MLKCKLTFNELVFHMDKKQLLAKFVSITGAGSFAARFLKQDISYLPILAYHRIKNINSSTGNPSLVSASIADFKWQMQYIKESYTPISFETLDRCLSGLLPWPNKPVIITFDDGFGDNYHNAYPILKKLNIPATFFISVDYIDSNKQFWFEGLYKTLKSAPEGHYKIDKNEFSFTLTNSKKERDTVIQLLFKQLATVENDQRELIVEQIFKLFKRHDTVSNQNDTPLTSEQIIEMSANGMEFGSHSMSHPFLNRLNIENLNLELKSSKEAIEKLTQKKCLSIAYPNGKKDNVNDDIYHAVEQANYHFGCLYSGGVNHTEKLQPFELNRIAVEHTIGHAYFKMRLELPAIFVKNYNEN